MYADFAVAKVGKYATSESGDTVEMVERPHGGISFVMADGQRSGKSAKAISNIATRKAIALLGEGTRDGVAARAAHDYLYAMRGGKVRADLQLLSLDLETRTIVVTLNTDTGAMIIENRTVRLVAGNAQPIGVHRTTRPQIHEFAVQPGIGVVLYSDGIRHAGARSGGTMDLAAIIEPLLFEEGLSASRLANTLLESAITADGGFPKDDLTVLALYLHPESPDDIRKLSVRFPIP